VDKLVRPELEGRVLDQLDEGDEQPPGMGSIHDQSLQQHPCDLFLNGLSICLSKQVEQAAGVVVGVGVGVPQLVGNAVEEQVPALSVHVHGQVLEDVHVAAVGDAAHTGAVTLCSDELYGLGSNIHDESIDHGDVVSHARISSIATGVLEICSQLGQEGDWGSVLQVAVQVLLETWFDQSSVIGHHAGCNRDLGQHVHLEIWSKWIRKPHVPGES